ncbi:biotin-dependent carboxyltransferase family protein [Pseudoalteromonas xiamenensis]|uniref:5-oxoprolinase subunit C family protein n=1 Tax=Pseudoalteromonas xiamenensis TaxID=882626 RepID=UPI0035EE1E9B
MIEVINPGPLSTVQDLGRFGHRQQGIPQSGVLDPLALIIGNRLLGNEDDAAAIEITAGNAVFRFMEDCSFVLMGSSLNATLNDMPIHSGWCMQAKQGNVLRLKGSQHALRSYLCFAGGIDVPLVLNSRSTDIQGQFGGLSGKPLQSGTVISLFKPHQTQVSAQGALQPPYFNHIRVLPGPHLACFDEHWKLRFTEKPWSVQLSSNRMGTRLIRDDVEFFNHNIRIPSQAVHPGVIQLPPSGEAMVLLADCQTTGGYPIIGQVIEADLRHFTQLGASEPVYFEFVDINTATKAHETTLFHLDRINIAIENNKKK